MSRTSSSYELTLSPRAPGQTLSTWLYAGLRRAILDGRLVAGTRLPASRDFALQQGVSRGTVLSVFERLQAEGYNSCRPGSGTRVEPARGSQKGPVPGSNTAGLHQLTAALERKNTGG